MSVLLESPSTSSPSGAAATSTEVELLIDSDHTEKLSSLQIQILGRLQDSNSVLSSFNDFSTRSLEAVAADFARNSKVLKGLQVDLEAIFRKIRQLKERVKKHHPEAMEVAIKASTLIDERPDLEVEA